MKRIIPLLILWLCLPLCVRAQQTIYTPDNLPKVHPWYGKPDVYHSLQACLAPLLPVAPSLIGAVRLAGAAAG